MWDREARDALTRYLAGRTVNYSEFSNSVKTEPIKNVIFNAPATIVVWGDGTKTVVKCAPGEVYDPEKGLAMAMAKKMLGNEGNYYNIFKKWLPEEEDEFELNIDVEGICSGLSNAAETLKKALNELV